MKICCPKCSWEPDGRPYWACSDCGTAWDTFSTAARCPGCGRQYKYTQCIGFAGGCDQSSLHLDWYKDLDDLLVEELEEMKEEVFVDAQVIPNLQ